MRNNLKSVIALVSVCAVVAVLLSVTNLLSAPVIEKNEANAANEALLVVMPGGKDFTLMDVSAYTLPNTVSEVYSEQGGGHVVKLITNGYSSGMVILCGVDASGTVTGATCLFSGETLGAEKTYGDKIVGKTLENIDSVDTIASVTKTTSAYRNAVKDALNTVVILGGGSVDLRSEEEILQDNLSAVLPGAEGVFSPWFMVEVLEGVSAVYTADNGSGTVFLLGDTFLAVDSSGAVLGEGDDSAKTKVASYAQLISQSKTELLDASAFALPSAITKTEKTLSGNYVFEVRASGFGINGDSYYNPSGEPIMIRISLTPEGKIIACQTLSQKETEGIGSACENPSFYTQFHGKDESNYREIDGISGATITTNGYKTAVGKALEAVKILKGEA